MYSNFFCEDNAGDIFVFVYYRDDLINVIHLHGDESIETVMDSCETGWPFADEYNPEDYGGLSMTAFLAELDIMGAEIIAEINGRELTPDFFRRARMGFLTEHSYDQLPKEKMWRCIESNCRLVATITNCHGFIVHGDHDMTRSSRKMFGKRARMNYDRRYNGGANYGGTIHSRANYCHKANQFA